MRGMGKQCGAVELTHHDKPKRCRAAVSSCWRLAVWNDGPLIPEGSTVAALNIELYCNIYSVSIV
jgi:hypothetical protein